MVLCVICRKNKATYLDNSGPEACDQCNEVLTEDQIQEWRYKAL